MMSYLKTLKGKEYEKFWRDIENELQKDESVPKRTKEDQAVPSPKQK